MNTIALLEQQIEEASGLLEQDKAFEATDLALDLSSLSLKRHIADLREQLRVQKALRGREVVELRLSGQEAKDGSLPLHLLGVLAEQFARSVTSTSRFLKTGTVSGSIPRDVVEGIDLRLEGLASGSTRLFVTGNTNPDRYGRSLLEESLRDTFRVLFASSDELSEAVSQIGVSAARSLRRMLESVARAGLELSMRWNSPRNEEMFWSAGPEEMRQIAGSLAGLTPAEPEKISVTGEVETLSLRRRFEVRAPEGSISAIVPFSLRESLKSYHVGQRVNVVFEKNTVVNRVTGRETTSYTVLAITPA